MTLLEVLAAAKRWFAPKPDIQKPADREDRSSMADLARLFQDQEPPQGQAH